MDTARLLESAQAGLDEARHNHAEREKKFAALGDFSWLPNCLRDNDHLAFIDCDAELTMQMPYDRVTFGAIKQQLELGGWIVTMLLDEEACIKFNTSGPSLRAQKDGHSLYLSAVDYLDGATCKRHKIGTVKKELDVIEFACANWDS